MTLSLNAILTIGEYNDAIRIDRFIHRTIADFSIVLYQQYQSSSF